MRSICPLFYGTDWLQVPDSPTWPKVKTIANHEASGGSVSAWNQRWQRLGLLDIRSPSELAGCAEGDALRNPSPPRLHPSPAPPSWSSLPRPVASRAATHTAGRAAAARGRFIMYGLSVSRTGPAMVEAAVATSQHLRGPAGRFLMACMDGAIHEGLMMRSIFRRLHILVCIPPSTLNFVLLNFCSLIFLQWSCACIRSAEASALRCSDLGLEEK